MRAQAIRLFIVGVCWSVLSPSIAHAQIGRGWLERLSGPGPFTGFVLEARLVCVAAPDRDQKAIADAFSSRPFAERLVFPKETDAYAWFSPVGCHFLERDQPRLEVGIQFDALSSRDNVLDYGHRPGLTQGDLEVGLNILLVTADVRVNRVVDLGASIGRAWFSSDGDLFGDFSRFTYQPFRVTMRPLAAFVPNRRAGLLLVQFNGTRFKDGFRAEDFGAVPGSYREPGEMVLGWSVKLDFTTLFW